jgi:hypothetical protein
MMNANTKSRLLKCLLLLTATLLIFAGCKKASQPQAAAPPASTPAKPIPAIATGGQQFGGDTWLAQKLAGDRNASAGAGQSYAHVSFKPEVKTIDEHAVLDSMAGVSTDGHGVVFNNASTEIRALKAGDIFMVQNDFAVKVLAAETNGNQTAILFDNAKLTDLVQQGTIHLDTPISFHGPSQAAVAPPSIFHFADLFALPAYAYPGQAEGAEPGLTQPSFATPKPGIDGGSASGQAADFAKALASGWTIESWSVTPSANSALVSGRMTKDTAGFLAAITMNGTISNFQFVQDLSFPVNTQQVATGLKGMSGKMNFTWEIGKNTPGVWAVEDKLKLPAGVTIPLAPMLGGIPLTLDVSAALLIHPALTGGNEYAKDSFAISWNGSGSSDGLTIQVLNDQGIAPVAPAAMVIAFCIPRVELQLSPLAPFGALKGIPSAAATIVDSVISRLESKYLSPATLQALQNSPLGNFSVSNVLTSNADIYAQIIHTEGTTRGAAISLVPCSKVQLKIDGEVGGDANLLGIIKGSSAVKNVFNKTYVQWDPPSNFCKSV